MGQFRIKNALPDETEEKYVSPLEGCFFIFDSFKKIPSLCLKGGWNLGYAEIFVSIVKQEHDVR